MSSPWCGYIDMLATRSIAQRNVRDLRDALNNFHSALDDSFEELGPGSCYAFSDGAFFSCPSSDEFSNFYRRIRNELFQQKIFFKCSLIPGEIEVNTRGDNPSRKGRFVSMTFGGDAPVAYQKESEFKGVGCSVHSSAVGEFVDSYYVTPGSGGISATPTRDVRYTHVELDRPRADAAPWEWRIFDPIIEACQTTTAQSTRVAAYYLTPIVSAIRSLDLRSVEFHDHEWLGAPYAFEEIATGSVPRALRQVPGIHFVLLTLFDHLFNQKNGNIPHAVEAQILGMMQKHPQCFRKLDEVKEFVITHPARARLINLHVNAERQIERTRRATRIRIARTAADSKARAAKTAADKERA